MRRARRIIVTIAGLLALLVLAVAILIATFDPNDFRDEIEARVAERIGRDLQLRGDISLSLFPWLAITTGDARLANPEGFGPEPFLALEGLRIGVRLLPLLAGRLEIGEIVLEAPRLQLVTDAEGRTNWQDLLAGDGGEGPTDVTAAGLVVENGEILIEDRAAGTSVRVSGLDLRVGRVALDEPVPITARMQIEQATDRAEVELEAEVTVALEPFELRVAEPRVDVALLSERLGTRAEALPIELRADEFSAADGHYLLIGLHLETALPLDSAPSGRLPLELRAGRIELDESLEQLAARALTVTAAGASLTAEVLEGQSLVDDPLVRAAFALEPIDLREVLPEAGIAVPATNDATALTRFAMQARLEATGSTVRLSDLDLRLDDTQVSGSLEVAFRDSAAVRFSLHADRLDAYRYLPPGQAGASTGEDSELPLERLRTLPVTGVLTIATATMAGTEVRDLRLELGSAAAGLELEHGGAPSMGPTTAARATVDPSEDREGRFRR